MNAVMSMKHMRCTSTFIRNFYESFTYISELFFKFVRNKKEYAQNFRPISSNRIRTKALNIQLYLS